MKILYFDTETTGTDPAKHEITQFAAIVEIDGRVMEEVNWTCQPKNWDDIEPKALETTGVGIEKLKTFQEPEKMYEDILALFQRYESKYDKGPFKFYPAGHNVGFDLDFLDAFFKRYGDADTKEWGITSWQNWRALDSRVFANFLFIAGKINTPNVKLNTLCDHYGIEIDAHDALSDIQATRSLVLRMMKELKGNEEPEGELSTALDVLETKRRNLTRSLKDMSINDPRYKTTWNARVEIIRKINDLNTKMGGVENGLPF